MPNFINLLNDYKELVKVNNKHPEFQHILDRLERKEKLLFNFIKNSGAGAIGGEKIVDVLEKVGAPLDHIKFIAENKNDEKKISEFLRKNITLWKFQPKELDVNMEMQSEDKLQEYILLGNKGIHSFIGYSTIASSRFITSFGKIYDTNLDLFRATKENNDVFSKNKNKTIEYLAYALNQEQINRFHMLYTELFNKKSQHSYENNKSCSISDAEALKLKIVVESFEKHLYKDSCRSSALKVLHYVLGRDDIGISKYWFIKPDFCMRSWNELYVLPQLPPKIPVTTGIQYEIDRIKMLQKIFKRLKDMVKKNPELQETRAKFEALKYIYENFSSEFKFSDYVKQNEKILFAMRNQGFFSRILGLKSSTEKLLTSFPKTLCMRP